MTTIFEDQDKIALDKICTDMGMNLSTFYMIYTKKVLRDRKTPFQTEASADPFLFRK